MSKSIPREKIGLILKWLINSPPPKFGMSMWFSRGVDYPGIDSVAELKENIPQYKECGFVACIAGTIQFKVAKTLLDQEINTGDFADAWLGWEGDEGDEGTFCPLFTMPRLYGKSTLNEIELQDAITTLIYLYNLEENTYPVLIRYMATHLNMSLIEWGEKEKLPLRKPSLRYKYVPK